MTRVLGLTLLTLSLLYTLAAPAAAQGATKITLDRFYESGLESGGTWKVILSAEPLGLARVSFSVDKVDSVTIVAPPELEEQSVVPTGLGYAFTIAQDGPPVTLGIGVPGGPFSSYVDPPNMPVHPAYSNLGSFTGGVVLAEGTFGPGQHPIWGGTSLGGPNAMTYWNSEGASQGGRILHTIRFTVIPEPASAGLAGVALAGMLVVSRRSVRRLARRG